MKNWRLYCAEALGLAIFMMSACFFTAMLEGNTSWHSTISNSFARLVITGVLMGSTALFIFYFPYTSISGSHINPAVTLTFLRLRRVSAGDAIAYIIAQVIGGTAAVYLCAFLLKDLLKAPPARYAITIPLQGTAKAFAAEMIIGFIMMSMVLYTSAHTRLKKYTRMFAASMVCIYVITAGPISGFGMNPARSLASAIPANTWTQFWIYIIAPITSMLMAAELRLYLDRRSLRVKTLRVMQKQNEKAA